MKTVLGPLKVVVTVLIMFLGTTVMAQTVVEGTTTTKTIDAGEVQRKIIDAGKVQTLSPGAIQQIDKPAVKRLDLPDCDIAGKLKDVRHTWRRKGLSGYISYNGIGFKIALINKGTKKFIGDIPIRVRAIKKSEQRLLKEENYMLRNLNIQNDYWVQTQNMRISFSYESDERQDIEVILDVDPNNTFKEAQRFRGNNRDVVHW